MTAAASAAAHAASHPPAAVDPWREALYPLLVVWVSGVAYWHLVRGYFWAEDFYYLYLLNDRRRLEFVLTPHGGHAQPFRNLVIGLFYWLFGGEAQWYFAAVLVSHLVNALLLFTLLRRITGREPLACVGALLWSTCGLAEGSLGWFSVYGHVLVGTFLLWVLSSLQRVASAPSEAARPALYAGWYVALLLGSLSFGTGIGIALVFPIVLSLWLPGRTHRRLRWAFWSLPWATVGLYVLCHVLYAAVAPHGDPMLRGVAGLLRAYWWTIPQMTVELLHFAAAALALGPYLPLAPATLTAAVGGVVWILIGGALLLATPPVRRRMAAALLLSVAAYAMVATGRAPLLGVASQSVAEAVAWPRYHYVGTIGLAIAACLALDTLRQRVALPRRLATGLLAAWIAVTLVGLLRHPYSTPHPVDARDQVTRVFYRIGRQASESRDPARVYIDNGRFHASGYSLQHGDFPGIAALFVALYPLDRVGDKDVYFIEKDAETVRAARTRPWTRTAGLLVTPEEYRRLEGDK